jgi:hypothetical protein
MAPTYLLVAFFSLWLLIITILLIRSLIHYNRLTANVSQKDLVSALNHLISVSSQNTDDLKSTSEKLSQEITQNKSHLQRLGFKRYNPFTDTGGDQSFSVALLDENGNGLMISSLHSRENTRLYAKKVENGKVNTQALSKEEQIVINEALK